MSTHRIKRGRHQPVETPKATNTNNNKVKRLTLTDWYELCEKFVAAKEEAPSLSRNAFLRSKASGPNFEDNQTMRNGFHRSLKKYNSGELKPCNRLRMRSRKYHAIEEKLLQYMQQQQQQQSKRHHYHPAQDIINNTMMLPYPEIKKRCLTWAKELGLDGFKCSNKWISDVLSRRAEIATVTNRKEGSGDRTTITKVDNDATATASASAGTNEQQRQQDHTASPVIGNKASEKDAATATVEKQVPPAKASVEASKISRTQTPVVVVAAAAATTTTSGKDFLEQGDNRSSDDEDISLERVLTGLKDVQTYCKKRKLDDASSLLQIVKKFINEKS
ncbi:unnamed protein product [Cylindrotheca closterium]|uniref:Uncharacterized protein n=1 Tax=Cylindrotheca closterium TaxID=2856 RepID=A0AAD2FZF0_9STRA|nr:unnamed protein product [Cylindrotheca closterium]